MKSPSVNYPAHPIQLEILRKLVYEETLKFNQLLGQIPFEVESDQFNYHLQQLVKNGLVKKTERNYFLTDQGQFIAGRLDSQLAKIVNHPKTGIGLIIYRRDKGGDSTQVLLGRRKKNPAKGEWSIYTEKVRLMEDISTTIERCIKNEIGEITNLSNQFAGIARLQEEKDHVVFDVFLHCFKIKLDTNNSQVDLQENTEMENQWFKLGEIDKIDLHSKVRRCIQKTVKDTQFYI